METDDVRNTSFDIYVKGQQVRTTGFFKSTSLASANQGSSGLARFRMFPFVERKGRRVDVYGEGIDVGAWVRKGREIEEDQESDEVKEAKRKKKEEEEKAASPGNATGGVYEFSDPTLHYRKNRPSLLPSTRKKMSRYNSIVRSSTWIWRGNTMDERSRR
jgi:hypothetical protein